MAMMKDDDDMQGHKVAGSHFGFSATKVGNLGATEYTLADLIVDVSISVESFQDRIERCVKAVVKALRRSPRVDNLLLRVTIFNHNIVELHGYKPLSNCNEDDYTGKFRAGGSTSLFDAAYSGIGAQATYAKELVKNDFQVNGIAIIITDGENTAGTFRDANPVKDILLKTKASEALESLITILVGVNVTDPQMKQHHDDFKNTAGLTQYVAIDDASEKKIAKLADFVSTSISSQSQALGTGGPSQTLTF